MCPSIGLKTHWKTIVDSKEWKLIYKAILNTIQIEGLYNTCRFMEIVKPF